MPAIYPQHIPTPLYIITTHIPYISHICLCNPIYSLSLRFPRPLPFSFYMPFPAPYTGIPESYLHTVKYSVQNMMSIKKYPVAKLQRRFKTKPKSPYFTRLKCIPVTDTKGYQKGIKGRTDGDSKAGLNG